MVFAANTLLKNLIEVEPGLATYKFTPILFNAGQVVADKRTPVQELFFPTTGFLCNVTETIHTSFLGCDSAAGIEGALGFPTFCSRLTAVSKVTALVMPVTEARSLVKT
jgi:hypothetical protein